MEDAVARQRLRGPTVAGRRTCESRSDPSSRADTASSASTRPSPKYESAQDAGATFVPALELSLPAEVDVLWCLVGSILLRYDAATGWTTYTA